MSDKRPEQMLTPTRQDHTCPSRGRLKIFFGACAGVGKTFAMVNAARAQAARGVDVLVGIVESHGHAETEALLAGLERLSLCSYAFFDKSLYEFDLDSALARKPKLILMDELAHSNVPGSRHSKRWQDIEELQRAGIDVYTTVDVQHLETLNDIVSGITGIKVWETVPDKVFDGADEVVIVDLTPDELLQRLKEGEVRAQEPAKRTVQDFFRRGNLIALRELALRRTADRVHAEIRQYRGQLAPTPVWQTRETLLACVGPGGNGAQVVRSAARLAARMNATWHAVFVETPKLRNMSVAGRYRVMENLRLAAQLGADTATLVDNELVPALVKYARQHNLGRLLVGRSRRARRPWKRTIATAISDAAPEIDVIKSADDAVVLGPSHPFAGVETEKVDANRFARQGYLAGAAVSGVASLVAMPLHGLVDNTNIAMVFLLAVMVVALCWGRGPAIMASFLNVAAFDLLYVPPVLTFAVSDAQYAFTFAVMLVVGLLTAHLTTDLRFQVKVAGRREERIRALYEMSRELSGALMMEQVAGICQRFAGTEFQARATLFAADDNDKLSEVAGIAALGCKTDLSVATWVYQHRTEAGFGTETLANSPERYLPLVAPTRTRGVLALEFPRELKTMSPEQIRLLDTFARLIAISMERLHYVEIARTTIVRMESEQLRNSVLSAISHDLRTPLAATASLAELLQVSRPALSDGQQEIANQLRDQTARLNSLVINLLDMARLQSGLVRLNLQWQPLEEVIGCALRSCEFSLLSNEVTVDIPSDFPLLEFDQVLMERVLSNLLENAGKYAAHTTVQIIARVKESEAEINVQDQGPGLPPGREEAIFERLERGPKEGGAPGVGLGLAICRSIMAAHGGRISAMNRLEGGARFVLSLPLGTPPGAVPEE